MKVKSALEIGSIKQLFLDDHVIEEMRGCRRQLHRPVRCEDNPLLEADQPWEQGGNGVYLFGGTVIFDEEEGRFKMWYRTSVVERSATKAWEEPKGSYRTCYALSEDGRVWHKPNLELDSYDGSKQNNILPPAPAPGGMEYVRRPNLIKDYEEPDPERRYKMAYMDDIDGKWVLSKAYSRDGIHWKMNVGTPVYFAPPAIPNGVLFGWDAGSGKYLLFHRQCTTIPADVDGRQVRRDLALVRSTSLDFDAWGETEEVIGPGECDPPRWEPGHVGVLAAFPYTEDLYLGFLDTCTTHQVEDVPEHLWENVYQHEHAEHRTELVISRDARNWKRVLPGWEFLRPGLWGGWDSNHVALSKPIVRNDQILIYYTGRNLSCKAQLPDSPQRALMHKVIDGQRMGYAIGLASMRSDGFASIQAYESEGTLTTRAMIFRGDRLVVNARAPETGFAAGSAGGAPHGRLRVEILDPQEPDRTGYSAADCDAFSGDAVRHLVTWQGQPDLGAFAGKPIRLRFHLKNAALYSFQFADQQARPSPINLLCPGCRGHGPNG